MGWLKKIIKKVDEVQKDVIKKTQDGIEHAATEATGEVNKIIEKADDKQQEILRKFQAEIEVELKKQYNRAIGELYDRLVAIFKTKDLFWQMLAVVMKNHKDKIMKDLI